MNGKRTAGRARAAALLILALSPACASAGLFDDEEARRQISQQQKRTDELRAQIDQVAVRVATIEETLKNQAALQQSQGQPVLELANPMEALRVESKSLRGQIEGVKNGI